MQQTCLQCQLPLPEQKCPPLRMCFRVLQECEEGDAASTTNYLVELDV